MKKFKNYMVKTASQIIEEELEQLKQLNTSEVVFSDNFNEKMKSIGMKKEKRKGWRVKTTWVAVILLFCLFQIILSQTIFKDVIVAAKIDYNLEKLEKLETEQLISSNPYDYMDRENYKNIVKMGVVAIEIIDERYYEGKISAKSTWIAGAIIEDISGIKVSELTGTDWETGEEFFRSWESIIKSISQDFLEIANSSLSLDEKKENYQKYGIYGEYFLHCLKHSSAEEIDFFGNTINISLWKDYDLSDNLLSDKEADIIEKYLKSKINMK